jgi:hypothetical protein
MIPILSSTIALPSGIKGIGRDDGIGIEEQRPISGENDSGNGPSTGAERYYYDGESSRPWNCRLFPASHHTFLGVDSIEDSANYIIRDVHRKH